MYTIDILTYYQYAYLLSYKIILQLLSHASSFFQDLVSFIKVSVQWYPGEKSP